jgi:formyltetrahydrofolate synthetase
MKEHIKPVLRTSPLESHAAANYGHVEPRSEPIPVLEKSAIRSKPDDRLVSLVSPATIEAEQYRTLGMMLEQRRHSGLLQVVAVSSPTMGDGKTVTSINLAGALAQSPQAARKTSRCRQPRYRKKPFRHCARWKKYVKPRLSSSRRESRRCRPRWVYATAPFLDFGTPF